MAYARERQERYIKTKKGKEAINRSRKKEQALLRSTLEGRITLRYRKIKCEWGKGVADWWFKQEPTCFVCGPDILYEKAPTRKKGRSNLAELVIDHDHKYTQKQYKKSKTLLPRGLLCHACNIAYGLTEEKIKTLKNMIAYKKKHG